MSTSRRLTLSLPLAAALFLLLSPSHARAQSSEAQPKKAQPKEAQSKEPRPTKESQPSEAQPKVFCDPARAGQMVRLIREATGLPVTAKIRSGWDANTKNFLQMADALGEAGVAALAVHPRTRAQGYAGQADWSEPTTGHRSLVGPRRSVPASWGTW